MMNKCDELIIKYHSLKMLLTLDLNKFIEKLINEYGNQIIVKYQEMDIKEQEKATSVQDGITIINERFWILESNNSEINRRTDLEVQIVNEGQK